MSPSTNAVIEGSVTQSLSVKRNEIIIIILKQKYKTGFLWV
jgi:hypothetical protein